MPPFGRNAALRCHSKLQDKRHKKLPGSGQCDYRIDEAETNSYVSLREIQTVSISILKEPNLFHCMETGGVSLDNGGNVGDE